MGINEENTVPEGKLLSNEDYDNYHRTKPITLGKWKYCHHSIQKIDSRDGTKITPVHFSNVEMNGFKVNVVPNSSTHNKLF